MLSHKVNVRLTLQTPPLATCSSHKTLLEQLQKTPYLTTVTTTSSGKSGRRPKKRLPTCCATGWFRVILSSLVILFVVCVCLLGLLLRVSTACAKKAARKPSITARRKNCSKNTSKGYTNLQGSFRSSWQPVCRHALTWTSTETKQRHVLTFLAKVVCFQKVEVTRTVVDREHDRQPEQV